MVSTLEEMPQFGRRGARAARRRGVRYGLLAGLVPATWVLISAWHEGQWRDALLFPAIILAATVIILLPFGALAWMASTQLNRHRIRPDSPAPSGSQAVWIALAVAAILTAFCLGIWHPSLAAIDTARATRMKSRGGGIFAATFNRMHIGLLFPLEETPPPQPYRIMRP